ncbi:MAG: hypothetical protein PHT12_05620 [Patescibacteria group bacterium]|nr:hypothetical protein [Patescibacteria group bacterium]
MAWYLDHELRVRGRLVKVTTRYGYLFSARVVKGKPLALANHDSRDWQRLEKLVDRSALIAREIADFKAGLDSYFGE